MSVTERLAGSGMLAKSCQAAAEAECHENDLRGYGDCLRVHHRHGSDHGDFAGFVMKAILMFLSRGFALFAGGPAVYQSPAFGRSIVVVATQKRGRGRSGW
jgi:hypothetical protein